MALDFSELQATPAQSGHLDFSALGAIPAVGGGPSEEDTTSALGAAGRGAVGMIPLGKQAYAGIESAVDEAPYLEKRKELEKDIEADIANHPEARLGGQVAGVVAPAILTGGASLPGGAVAEGALIGAGFGAGNAIDTIASGGSNEKAVGDVALGTLTGAAGGTAGKALGNVATGIAKPFINSQDEIMAEATAGILGGTTRQIRALPGKNPVQTLTKLGQDMAKYKVNGEPLIKVTDQMPARLDKFIALQKEAGQTIGDTIKNSNVAPIASKPVIEELNTALKFATPDDQTQMTAVINQLQKYTDENGTIPFDRLQLLKGELGDEAFHGQGNPVLQSAYHVISDVQDRELDRISSQINKPAFDEAKNAYQMTSRAIPMLRMGVSKEVGGKTNLLVPGAALLSGHPLVAAGALAKNRLGQMASGATFKGIQALPENAGAAIAGLPAKAGAQASASVQQNMGETKPLPGQVAPSPSKMMPHLLNVDHPAMAQWRPIFQKNAANAKNPSEIEKSHAVTDFILSQRDPSYAAAKQKMADEPVMETKSPNLHMADGGIVPDTNDPVVKNAESIEPGIMGETEPPEQKMLAALNKLGEGYGMGQIGGTGLTKGPQFVKGLGEKGAIFPDVSPAKSVFKTVKPGDYVNGRIVGKEIPNQNSISASLSNYEVQPGIREVPFRSFTQMGPRIPSYSAQENARTKALTDEISKSNRIDPLIVVMDKEGPYILEGGHRFDALRDLNAESFPAVVVKDLDSLGMAEGGIVAEEKPESDYGTLVGLRDTLKKAHGMQIPKSEPVPMENKPKFHEPFNSDFADKLKAFLEEHKDAQPR